MSTQQRVIDRGNEFCFLADDVCALVRAGSVTHVIFTVRMPGTDGEIFRTVQARMIVPENCVQQIGRALLRNQSFSTDSAEFEESTASLN
jgi:hypothetical protein